MGVEEAGRAATGKKLALASIGFADVRVGAAVPGGAGVYKDGLLVVGLPVPKDDGLDAAARVVGDLAARLPDVGAAARVSNWSRLQISVSSCLVLCSGIWMDVL
jgi:solute carrier family 25 phosphate transporter 23/24/25/41